MMQFSEFLCLFGLRLKVHCRSPSRKICRTRLYLAFKVSASTTASLCSSSFAPKSKVSVPCSFAIFFSSATNSFFFVNSPRYFFWNLIHFSGLCPNHFRSASLGATSFIQTSRCAASFFIPLGHRRSTSTRHPSSFFFRRFFINPLNFNHRCSRIRSRLTRFCLADSVSLQKRQHLIVNL